MIFLAIAAKGVLVLALAAAASLLLRRAPASARHGVWAAAFGALLLLPLLEAVGPRWDVGVLPAEEPAVTAVFRVDGRPAIVAGPGAAAVGARAPLSDAEVWIADHASAPVVPRALVLPEAGSGSVLLSERIHVAPAPRASAPWWTWALGVWGLGALAVGLGWLAAALAARRVVANARPETDEEWGVLAERARRLLGIEERVRLLRSDALDVPIAWGWGHPAVVLPIGADDWDDDRREAVLLHEMAHVMRRDAWTQAVAQVAVALHWPNPLAWWGYRRLLDTREQACDDAVLQGGARPSTYAAHLVGVARALRQDRLALVGAAPMARTAPLEGRITSILDAGRRRDRLGRPGLGATLLFAATVVLPLGAFQPVAQAALPTPLKIVAAEAPAPALPAVPSLAPAVPEAPAAPEVPAAPETPAVPEAVPRAFAVLADTTDEECDDDHKHEIDHALRHSQETIERARQEIRRAMRDMESVSPEIDALRAEALREAELAIADIDLGELQSELQEAVREAMEDLRESEIDLRDVRREAREIEREVEREMRDLQRELHEAQRERERELRRDERDRERALRRSEQNRARPSGWAPRPDPKPMPEPRPAPRPTASLSTDASFDWDAIDRARADAVARVDTLSVAAS